MLPGRRRTDVTTSHLEGLTPVVERNIDALLERRERAERNRSRQTIVADAVTRFAGSMPFVYVHLVIFGAWILINLGAVPGVPRFDPTFVVLGMVASVEAIFLSTFVLITQNRMQAHAESREELDLQVSLLAEHEVTRVIQLVTAMAEKMGVDQARDPELVELERDIAPERVMDRIEERTSEMERHERRPRHARHERGARDPDRPRRADEPGDETNAG